MSQPVSPQVRQLDADRPPGIPAAPLRHAIGRVGKLRSGRTTSGCGTKVRTPRGCGGAGSGTCRGGGRSRRHAGRIEGGWYPDGIPAARSATGGASAVCGRVCSSRIVGGHAVGLGEGRLHPTHAGAGRADSQSPYRCRRDGAGPHGNGQDRRLCAPDPGTRFPAPLGEWHAGSGARAHP